MMMDNRMGWMVWAICSAIASLLIAATIGMNAKGTEVLAIFLIVGCLSIVDSSIRKIPNELLAALLITRIFVMINQGSAVELKPALMGLLAGFLIFQLPAMLRISIGWGDVKYAAAAGFYLGLIGLFQAIAVMSLALGFYTLYLYLTRRGTIKTKVAMGPSFSLGLFATILYPIAVNF